MKAISQKTGNTDFARRKFLKGSAGLTFALAFGPLGLELVGAQAPAPNAERALGAWIKIGTDGSMLIYNPAAEMGQGTMTALPIIVAEELDADWSMIRIEHSPIEPDIYGRAGWGDRRTMMTVGSYAVRGYFTQLRIAGAQIRRVLLENAARNLQVPVAELTTEPSMVVHATSGKRISYGKIVSFARVPAQLSPGDFRLIGHPVPRHDIPEKTDGRARFAMDVHLPGMLYGMVTRSPVHNGHPVSHNEAEVQAMPGVTASVSLDHGIGLIGQSIEEVLNARKVLKIEWAKGNPAKNFDSEAALAVYAQIAGNDQAESRPISHKGDASQAMRKAVKRFQSDFLADYAYHAQMEPLNALSCPDGTTQRRGVRQ